MTKNKARAAVVDCRASKEIIKNLNKYANDIILMPPSPRLALPVASHTDMLIWTNGNEIFIYSHYLSVAAEQFAKLSSLGYKIIPVEEEADKIYPRDVHLNCAVVGTHLFANRRSVSKSILDSIKLSQISLIHTNQGYAKCSICKVSDNAIITSDRSIHEAALSANINSLLICEGSVLLDGYDHGFIGGASGNDGKRVFFCGDISMHPESERITSFIASHKMQIISLSDDPLYDLGTILFL